VLTCPYCKNPLRDSDVAREICPHCQQSVRPGLGTIDSDSGGVTIVLPPESTGRDSTMTRDRTTTQADVSPPTPMPVPASTANPTPTSAGNPVAPSDPRNSQTLDSTDEPVLREEASKEGAGRKSGYEATLDSSVTSDKSGFGWPESDDSPGGPKDKGKSADLTRRSGYEATLDSSVASDQPGFGWQESADLHPESNGLGSAGKSSDSPRKSDYEATLDSSVASDQPGSGWHGSAGLHPESKGLGGAGKSSDSPRKSGYDATLESSVASDQPGSKISQFEMRGPPSREASQDDVDRRLRQVWGSQMQSARPQHTLRGSESGKVREENSTLIIRERALRNPTQSTGPVALADYDLLGVLGEGGMGVVYNARQASIDREVAVKMLKPDMAANASQRRKFLSEAAVTGELDHPNIVPIYDLGQNADGALFYSMKKVTGTPWSEVIKQKSLLDNLTILMKVCDAIAFAHARGVVHRDLKPENIMLGDFGEVLVLDWGLAVATEGHRPTPNVAQAFNIAGTPAYMSPELAMGPMEAIGRHSDIYLLGAILFECVTGRPPHYGKNARECLKAAARNEIVAVEKRGELLDIAFEAMATDPAKRHSTVQDFQTAIRTYQAHSESIVLCERAEVGIRQAATSENYQDFARALFAFQEAVELWPGNENAKAGVSRAKLHYATSALGKSDFDLGLSLLDSDDLSHDAVRSQLVAAKTERDARQKRLKRARQAMVALAATVFLAVSVGVVIATYLAHLARESEKSAVASANLALKNETIAKEKEALAQEKEELAIAEAERAGIAEKEAKRRREEAVASAYTALIAMAAARVDENSFDQARQALELCDPKHRGWEWRRLMHVVTQGDVSQVQLASRAESLAISASGSLLAAGSLDGVVRLWSATDRKLVGERKLGENSTRVTAVAFHPGDDRWLAVGTSDPSQPLIAWNRESGELRVPADEHRHRGGLTQAAFSADGQQLLTASEDRTARLWDWNALTSVPFAGHTGTVWSAALSTDGKKLATASEDGSVRLWDVATRQQERSRSGQRIPFTAHRGPVYAVVFLPPDIASEISLPVGDPAKESSPAYQLASAGYDKRILLWQTDNLVPFDFEELVQGTPVAEAEFQELTGHSAAVRSISISADGSRLASAGVDHTIRVWDLHSRGATRQGSLVKELRGHAGPVYAAVFSPLDANSLVSTGYDDRLRLWSIDLYQEQRVLPGLALRGHVGPVLSARFSADGQNIITASLDRTARKWNSRSAIEETVYREGHSYLASRATFFPESRRLLTAGGDGTVRVWDLDKQAELLVLPRTGYRAAAAISPDERTILTGSSDVLTDTARPHGALVWNAKTGEPMHKLVGAHKVPVTMVAYGPKGAGPVLALTGDDNGVLQLWRAEDGVPVGPRVDRHGSPIVGAEFAADGRSLVTADAGGQVYRWDITDPANIQLAHKFPPAQGILSIALLPNGCLLTGGTDGRLRLFEADGQEPIWSTESPATPRQDFVSAEQPITEAISSIAVHWDADAEQAVVIALHSRRRSSETGGGTAEEELVRVFEMDWPQQRFEEVFIAGAEGPINLRAKGAVGWFAAIAPGGREFVTIGRDEARLWDREGHELAAFRPHQDLTFAEFSHAGDLVVTASLDRSVRVWDAASGRPRMTLDEHTAGPLGGHGQPVNCAVFVPGDRYVLTGSEDGTVRQWDLSTMRVVQVISASPRGITRLAITQSGQQVIAVSRSGEGAIWSLAAPAAPLHRLVGHTGAILDVALSPDEAWVVTASADNTAKIWDANTGKEILSLVGHASEVTSVAILADAPGLRVLTGSNDQTAKLWAIDGLAPAAAGSTAAGTAADKPEAQEILSLRGHSRGLTSVAFAPDGGAALTASRDGMTILWPAIAQPSP
jgi:WD40 repeat protein